MRMLLKTMDEKAEQTKGTSAIDLPLTLQYLTFDAGGVFSFSGPYRFLRDRIEIDGIIQSVRVGSMHLNRVSLRIVVRSLRLMLLTASSSSHASIPDR